MNIFHRTFILDQTPWNEDDDIKKCRLFHNTQNIDMVDTVFEVVGFDHDNAIKWNLPIVNAIYFP